MRVSDLIGTVWVYAERQCIRLLVTSPHLWNRAVWRACECRDRRLREFQVHLFSQFSRSLGVPFDRWIAGPKWIDPRIEL